MGMVVRLHFPNSRLREEKDDARELTFAELTENVKQVQVGKKDLFFLFQPALPMCIHGKLS